MRRPILPTIALALVLAAPAGADDIKTAIDRFNLWNKCQPLMLVVEDLPNDAAKIGLTREAIIAAVRSRLRAARLYSDQSRAYLYVNINVVGRAYNLSVEYNKLVKDLASGEIQSATTWDRSVTGTHGGNDSGILSLVSQYMDRFIDEYLRVNTDACRSSN